MLLDRLVQRVVALVHVLVELVRIAIKSPTLDGDVCVSPIELVIIVAVFA